jgi:hypothetical protein
MPRATKIKMRWFPGSHFVTSPAFGRAFQPISALLELYSQLQQCRFHVPLIGFIPKFQTFMGPQSIFFRSRHMAIFP